MKVLIALFVVSLIAFATTSLAKANANVKIANLDAKQQALVPIAANIASGDIAKLKVALNEGLDAGLTVNETKEIMVHLYAYCGFPRALNGLSALDEVLANRQAKGIHEEVGKEATPIPQNTDMLALGTKVQTQLAGGPVNIKNSPAIDTFLKTHLFGDLFARDVLDFKAREIVTLAALASMQGTQPQFAAHLHLGQNAGLSDEELQDIVNILDSKVNSDIAQNAQSILDNYLAKK